MDLVTEITKLKQLIEVKDKTISALEGRVSDLEQHTRINKIVITGLDISHALRGPEGGGAHSDLDMQSVQ